MEKNVRSDVNMHAHTRNIPEDSAKPYIFYPVSKSTKTKSPKLTKLVTMCLNYNSAKMAIATQY